MTVGEKIKEFRKEKGLTQKELSKLADIPLPTLQKYETGKFNPKVEAIKKIAAALDIPLLRFANVAGVAISELSDDENKIFVELIEGTPSYAEELNKMMSEMVAKAREIMTPETKKAIEFISYIRNSDMKLFGIDEFDLEKGDIVIKAGSYSPDELTELCNYMIYIKSKRKNNPPESQ